MDDFKKLTLQVKKFMKEREWDKGREAKDEAIDMCVESGEVLEFFQWKKGKELDDYIKANKNKIGEELADVLYALLLLSDLLKIDMKKAFLNKMKKNALKYPINKAKGNHKKYTEFN